MFNNPALPPLAWRWLAGMALFAAGGVSTLRAELTWRTKTVELHPAPGAAVVEARFPFTNDSPAAMDIRDVQSSCGCTAVTLVQRHYEPGQSGEIVARYTVGARTGVQSKTVAVATNDTPELVVLTLVVHPAEWLHAEPLYVTWKQGDPGAPQTIRLTPAQDAQPIQDVTAQSSDPRMTVEVQPVAGSSAYQVRVTPTGTDQALFSTLTVRFHVRGQEKTLRCFAFVQAQRPAGR